MLFKELLDTKVTQSSHPAPSLNKVAMLCACLKSAGYKFPENIQAMLLLAKLPPSMDIVVQMFAKAKDISGKAKTPTVEEIQVAMVLSWDQCHIKDTPKAAWANKISTIKHKWDDPKFEQQQALQGNGSKKKWKCGKCAGKKQKEKESKDSSSQMHTHITSVTYTSGPEPPVDPHALTHCPALMYQGEQGPPFHTGIKDVIALTHRLELPVTMENIHRLSTRLQIQGPGFSSATVCLPSHLSSPCPPSLMFSSVQVTTPLEYQLGIPISLCDFSVTDRHLLDDEWLNGDSSTSHSLLSQAAEMQDTNTIASSSTITLDSLPPTDQWNEDDLINIYSSEAADGDNGFIWMCSSVLHSLIDPHDLLIAALASTASSYINMYGSVHPCNENHCNCSKCVHQCEKFLNHWILDSGALMHFTPRRDAFTSYHKFSKDKHLHTCANSCFNHLCVRKRNHSIMTMIISTLMIWSCMTLDIYPTLVSTLFLLGSYYKWELKWLEKWIPSLWIPSLWHMGKLDEEIYMKQPEGFTFKGQEHKVLRLKRALYSLKQAGLAWWETLNESMKDLGFECLKSDAGIFLYRKKRTAVITLMMLSFVVLISKLSRRLKLLLCMKCWECRDLGPAKEFLHMNIRWQGSKIMIDQCAYLEKILQRFNLVNACVAPTPLP